MQLPKWVKDNEIRARIAAAQKRHIPVEDLEDQLRAAETLPAAPYSGHFTPLRRKGRVT